jgi:hypothetical protein
VLIYPGQPQMMAGAAVSAMVQNRPDRPTLDFELAYCDGRHVHDITKRILQILSG